MWIIATILKMTKKVVEDSMMTFLELYYRQGYNDFKQGKPAQSWDIAISQLPKNNLVAIEMARGFANSYKEGYEDAVKDVFLVNEKVQKIRQEILEELKKLGETVNNSCRV